jgi:hypothetical protein
MTEKVKNTAARKMKRFLLERFRHMLTELVEAGGILCGLQSGLCSAAPAMSIYRQGMEWSVYDAAGTEGPGL